jgi:hypothetical protein
MEKGSPVVRRKRGSGDRVFGVKKKGAGPPAPFE